MSQRRSVDRVVGEAMPIIAVWRGSLADRADPINGSVAMKKLTTPVWGQCLLEITSGLLAAFPPSPTLVAVYHSRCLIRQGGLFAVQQTPSTDPAQSGETMHVILKWRKPVTGNRLARTFLRDVSGTAAEKLALLRNSIPPAHWTAWTLSRCV